MASLSDINMTSDQSDLSIVKGNIVDISTPTKNTSNQLATLQSDLGSSILPDGMTADSILNDSLRCRIKELGGKILDLIEDGFGLGSILESLKEPDLSKLGDALKSLSPANLLEKLKDISLEDIGEQIGKVIDGAVGYVVDIVKGTFDQIEKIMKGLGGAFDSFGDRIEDLGEFASDTINNIVSGIGDVLSNIGDVPGMIADTIEKLLAPCAELPNNPNTIAQANIANNKLLFNSNEDVVKGNVVAVGEIGHTTGTFTRQAKTVALQQASGGAIKSIDQTGSPIGPDGDSADPVNVPIAHDKDAEESDGKQAQDRESKERAKAESDTTKVAVDVIKEEQKADVAKNAQATAAKDIPTASDGDAVQEVEDQGIFSPPGNCDSLFVEVEKMSGEIWRYIQRVEDLIRGELDYGTRLPETTLWPIMIVYNNKTHKLFYEWSPYMAKSSFTQKEPKKFQTARQWKKRLVDISVPITAEDLEKISQYSEHFFEKLEVWKKCHFIDDTQETVRKWVVGFSNSRSLDKTFQRIRNILKKPPERIYPDDEWESAIHKFMT